MSVTADEDLAFAGPRALAELVRTRQVRPRELVELCLRRIEALNPRLNAFRTTMAEEALAAADGVREGPLGGVPIAIKDEMDIAGQTAMRGARSYRPPTSGDGEIVRRLRAAGAIPIGITNVPELMIFPWTASDANGITRNPWDPTRTPGGSSGGSAAAVAAGMVPVATAADGGGSIRIPASCCGLVGMKPTRGRVSLAPLPEDWLGLTVFGALTRTVGDSALMLDTIHGPAEGDKHVAPAFSGRYVDAAATAPQRLRVAISRKIPPGLIAKVSSDQSGAWERTAALLAELGHEVVERDPVTEALGQRPGLERGESIARGSGGGHRPQANTGLTASGEQLVPGGPARYRAGGQKPHREHRRDARDQQHGEPDAQRPAGADHQDHDSDYRDRRRDREKAKRRADHATALPLELTVLD